jgi:hypothetical protein
MTMWNHRPAFPQGKDLLSERQLFRDAGDLRIFEPDALSSTLRRLCFPVDPIEVNEFEYFSHINLAEQSFDLRLPGCGFYVPLFEDRSQFIDIVEPFYHLGTDILGEQLLSAQCLNQGKRQKRSNGLKSECPSSQGGRLFWGFNGK